MFGCKKCLNGEWIKVKALYPDLTMPKGHAQVDDCCDCTLSVGELESRPIRHKCVQPRVAHGLGRSERQ